jgi:F-type H+-transporting ATPase subunit epsilon
MSALKCVVITPEKTELEIEAQSVTLPMYDGEMGILKDHSPLVGRLGFGVLRIQGAADQSRYFIEGGFAQVASNVVSVLTDRLIPVSAITAESAQAAMQSALEMPTDQPELTVARNKSIQRAQAMMRVAGSS